MALGAIRRKFELRMVRLRGLKFFRMAAVTLGGHGGVVTQRTIFVTRVALHGRMGPEQREAIVVILDLLCLDFPAFHRMALFAVRS